LASLDRELSRTEPDPEIHALIHDSAGMNLAIDYLPGALTFDPVIHAMSAELASRLVWFDALVTNVDRTARNTNMLLWHRAPWIIDHGASLYFHHSPGWELDTRRPRAAFPGIKEHVELRSATQLREVDAPLADALHGQAIDEILAMVPDDWLVKGSGPGPAEVRDGYRRYFRDRLQPPRGFVEEAVEAAGVR
jgi:hypothetical protein